eukprot:354548-Chlamydomonas_euryale.AAC.11
MQRLTDGQPKLQTSRKRLRRSFIEFMRSCSRCGLVCCHLRTKRAHQDMACRKLDKLRRPLDRAVEIPWVHANSAVLQHGPHLDVRLTSATRGLQFPAVPDKALPVVDPTRPLVMQECWPDKVLGRMRLWARQQSNFRVGTDGVTTTAGSAGGGTCGRNAPVMQAAWQLVTRHARSERTGDASSLAAGDAAGPASAGRRVGWDTIVGTASP